jgi:hypothetical protein
MLTNRPSPEHTSLAQSDHSGPVTLFSALGNTVSPPCSGVVLSQAGRAVSLGIRPRWKCSKHQQHGISRLNEQPAGGAWAVKRRMGQTAHRYMRTVAMRCPPFSGRALTLSWK